MAQEQLKFLLINYSKTLGKYNRVVYPKQPEKTIKGNVLITVPQSYVDEFNIPSQYVKNYSNFFTEYKEFERRYVRENLITQTRVRSHNKKLKVTKKGKLAVLKKLKTGSGFISPQFSLESYSFRFPNFFNKSMIDQCLFSITQNYSKQERLFLKIGDTISPLLGEETGWGSAILSSGFIEEIDHPSKLWGKITICDL